MPSWKKVITSGSDASLNSLNLSSVVNAGLDTDKFLVLDSAGNVDFRTGANVLSDINPGGLISSSVQIDHDSTTGFVANEHIDHSTVSITAGNGLSGGGTIAATRTLSLDTTSATFTNGVKTKLNTEGVISSSVQIDHDSTTGFVANEHIDHSTVSITAGNGLTGGGTIAANRTINVASANNGIIVNADNIQLDTTSTTFTSGVKTKLNTEGVISSSAQITENIHPHQTYVDFKGQGQGSMPWGTTTDLQVNNQAFAVWTAPAAGYIGEVYVSPETTNTPPDNFEITMFTNGGPVGGAVTTMLGAAGNNVVFTFGNGYPFAKGDRVTLDLNKFGNGSDLYAIQVAFRVNN